jgi:hypothetical protein
LFSKYLDDGVAMSPLFGILILEREPLTLQNIPALIQVWIQDAGGFAAVGLFVYILYAMLSPADMRGRRRLPVTMGMLYAAAACLICYACYVALLRLKIGLPPVPARQLSEALAPPAPTLQFQLQPLFLTLGGMFGLIGFGLPFLGDCFKMSFRRIWAISRLSVLEAYRSSFFLIFVLFLGVFLFPAKWFIQPKPEDELRMSLDVMSFVTAFLLILPALILAAFRIPNDIKNQTIYTIVTKPVEKFEIVFGRFLGYTTLMTITLAIMTTVGWVYITFGTTLDEKAIEETQRARVPLRGKLDFKARKDDYQGTNVGREYDYRKYIGGAKTTTERAIYSFDLVPSTLTTNRDRVPVEFTFDVFKLTKGTEDGGVDVNIRLCAHQVGQEPPLVRGEGVWRWTNAEAERAYETDRKAAEDKLRTMPNAPRTLADAKPDTPAWALVNDLAAKHGIFEIGTTKVFDYHPGTVVAPAGLFRKAAEGSPKSGEPRLKIYVKCLTEGQMLGMAPADLYVMEGEKTFSENFFKNAFGLWCRATIVIGIAVCLSTYLAGVISLLGAGLLYLSAYMSEHLLDVAQGTSTGGGPFESLTRLLRADTPTAQLDKTAALQGIEFGDNVFRWVFRRYANVVPDVDAYNWTNHLMEGFNINVEFLVVNFIVLVGYLLPWMVLGYYLMRGREVAE